MVAVEKQNEMLRKKEGKLQSKLSRKDKQLEALKKQIDTHLEEYAEAQDLLALQKKKEKWMKNAMERVEGLNVDELEVEWERKLEKHFPQWKSRLDKIAAEREPDEITELFIQPSVSPLTNSQSRASTFLGSQRRLTDTLHDEEGENENEKREKNAEEEEDGEKGADEVTVKRNRQKTVSERHRSVGKKIMPFLIRRPTRAELVDRKILLPEDNEEDSTTLSSSAPVVKTRIHPLAPNGINNSQHQPPKVPIRKVPQPPLSSTTKQGDEGASLDALPASASLDALPRNVRELTGHASRSGGESEKKKKVTEEKDKEEADEAKPKKKVKKKVVKKKKVKAPSPPPPSGDGGGGEQQPQPQQQKKGGEGVKPVTQEAWDKKAPPPPAPDKEKDKKEAAAVVPITKRGVGEIARKFESKEAPSEIGRNSSSNNTTLTSKLEGSGSGVPRWISERQLRSATLALENSGAASGRTGVVKDLIEHQANNKGKVPPVVPEKVTVETH